MGNSIITNALQDERREVSRSLLAGLFVALSTIGLSATSAWLIVRAAQRPAILSLTVPMGLVQLFALSKAAGRYMERMQTHATALAAMGRVRVALALALERLLPAGLGPRSVEVIDVALHDVERAQSFMTAVAGPLLVSLAAGLISDLTLFVLLPRAAGTLLLAILAVGIAIPLLGVKWGRRGENDDLSLRQSLIKVVEASVLSREEILFCGGREEIMAALARIEIQHQQVRQRQFWRVGILQGLVSFLSAVFIAITVFQTKQAVSGHHLAVVYVAIPALLSIAALELIAGVAPTLLRFHGDLESIRHLDRLIQKPSVVKEPSSTVSVPVEGTLATQDLGISFGERAIVRGANVVLPSRGLVSLSGHSGSGKTTIAHVLARFLDPTAGGVLWGDVAYENMHVSDSRKLVALNGDSPHVFATSLLGNLRVADRNLTSERALEVLEEVGLGELLSTMPNGLEAEIGGTYPRLSGGERRRLGVARALLMRAKVQIFDEPTEGLDPDAVSLVQRALLKRAQDSTVLVLSHDARIIEAADIHMKVQDGSLMVQ